MKGGDHLHDFSPYDNHGTLKNNPTWKDGSYGWALDFPGSDEYVEVPDDASFDVSEITVSIWVYRDEVSDETSIMPISRIPSWDNCWAIRLLNSDTDPCDFRWRISSGGNNYVIDIADVIEVGKWYHLVGVYDGSNMKSYLNGKQQGSKASGWTTDLTAAVYIGSHVGILSSRENRHRPHLFYR